MKALVVIGENRGPDGTPYVLMQMEDDAYGEGQLRKYFEDCLQDALRHKFHGIPSRLVWIEAMEGYPVPQDMLTSLIDGALIPWDILQDRMLGAP